MKRGPLIFTSIGQSCTFRQEEINELQVPKEGGKVKWCRRFLVPGVWIGALGDQSLRNACVTFLNCPVKRGESELILRVDICASGQGDINCGHDVVLGSPKKRLLATD